MIHTLKYNLDNMKINKYNSFLKENIRDDEYSYLNDELDMNKDYDDDYDYVDSQDKGEQMEHLLYLLRTMFTNSGIENIEIENDGLNVSIGVEVRPREKLRDIVKIFEVVNKLKRDILPQYESEFEMWETKEKNPLFLFNFYYDEKLSGEFF
jgi:hypothetical protein